MLLKLKELKKSTNNQIMKQTIRRVLTKKEIDIIIKQLQLFPENKMHAFKTASELLKYRSEYAIKNYYYNTLHKQQTITITGSAVGFTSNTKNVKRKNDGSFERKEPLKPMFVILRQLLTLEPKELLKVKLILEEVC